MCAGSDPHLDLLVTSYLSPRGTSRLVGPPGGPDRSLRETAHLVGPLAPRDRPPRGTASLIIGNTLLALMNGVKVGPIGHSSREDLS